jgi:hypothetical protein
LKITFSETLGVTENAEGEKEEASGVKERPEE